jgi:hypothetical protein|tara:strand:+ start:234 stop:368 length:135 start_codon:yes stop_codon:yes gene_type:complete
MKGEVQLVAIGGGKKGRAKGGKKFGSGRGRGKKKKKNKGGKGKN